VISLDKDHQSVRIIATHIAKRYTWCTYYRTADVQQKIFSLGILFELFKHHENDENVDILYPVSYDNIDEPLKIVIIYTIPLYGYINESKMTLTLKSVPISSGTIFMSKIKDFCLHIQRVMKDETIDEQCTKIQETARQYIEIENDVKDEIDCYCDTINNHEHTINTLEDTIKSQKNMIDTLRAENLKLVNANAKDIVNDLTNILQPLQCFVEKYKNLVSQIDTVVPQQTNNMLELSNDKLNETIQKVVKKSIVDIYFDYHYDHTKIYGSKTVTFIQRGVFHEAYSTDNEGFDFEEIADLLFLKVARVHPKRKDSGMVDRSNPYIMGFPTCAIDRYLSKLIDNGYTVVVLNETPSGMKSRYVTAIYSPKIEN